MSWAWAAGLFEGEGSIIIQNYSHGGRGFKLQLSMVDKDVVKKFHEVVKCGQLHEF